MTCFDEEVREWHVVGKQAFQRSEEVVVQFLLADFVYDGSMALPCSFVLDDVQCVKGERFDGGGILE